MTLLLLQSGESCRRHVAVFQLTTSFDCYNRSASGGASLVTAWHSCQTLLDWRLCSHAVTSLGQPSHNSAAATLHVCLP